MRIYSWNVNGLRAVINKGSFDKFIKEYDPDILLLQEIKVKEFQISLNYSQYNIYLNSAEKPGYSGTALFSKQKPINILRGIPEDIIAKYKVSADEYGEINQEGRVITAEFSKFFIVSVYTPNAKDDLSRLELRHQKWDPAFLAYMDQLNHKKPVIFGGDLNVAHQEEDLANPKPNIGKKGFTVQEREGIDNMLNRKFLDSFRLFTHGNGYYTWWSHFAKARERNVGWRIDYFMISEELIKKLKNSKIHPEVLGSDHCPISIELNI